MNRFEYLFLNKNKNNTVIENNNNEELIIKFTIAGTTMTCIITIYIIIIYIFKLYKFLKNYFQYENEEIIETQTSRATAPEISIDQLINQLINQISPNFVSSPASTIEVDQTVTRTNIYEICDNENNNNILRNKELAI